METNLHRALIEHCRDAIWLLARDGAIVYAGGASQSLLGYAPAELTGSSGFDFILPSDRHAARERLCARGGGSIALRMRRKDGTVIWVDAGAGSLDQEEESRLVLWLRDITAQHRAEQALRQSEQRFRALIENSADGFVLLDREGRVIYSGPAVLGYAHGEFQGRNVLELIHPDDLPAAIQGLAAIVTHPGKAITSEYRGRHADGSWRWMEATAKNLLTDPAVGGLVVNYRDITERKRHEDEMRRARDQVRNILESIQEAFIALDREWRFTYSNRRVAETVGKLPEEMLGRNIWELFPDARNTEFYPQYQRVMTERVPVHFEVFYPATGHWLDVHAYPSEEGLSAYVLDITDRKRP